MIGVDLQARYRERLSSLPKPGYGLCFHTKSLGVADLGVTAGLSPEQIVADLHQAAQGGKRREPDSQIINTVRRALADHGDGRFVPVPRPKPIIRNGAAVLRKLIGQGRGVTEADMRKASPVPIDGKDDTVLALQNLYGENDRIFVGERYNEGMMGATIRTCAEWIEHFRGGGKPGPHIIVNPLTGAPAPKKSDREKMTYRGDGNVAAYRFCVVEFDGLSREDQIAFWSVADLPVCALVDSGRRSLHAWLSVPRLAPVSTDEEWDKHIQDELYHQILVPMGVDGSCSNSARLSRLPGHLRDTGRMQRLLYLAPEGRRIFS